MADRKYEHISLAFKSQTVTNEHDDRFYYEPFLKSHPHGDSKPFQFVGKTMKSPLWVSSMTGGTELANKINTNIARACKEFGLGMGLGSCRKLLKSDEFFDDFNMRDVIGDEYPFYANLGIAQVELLLAKKQTGLIDILIDRLRADGLFIHVNPLQEWFQPEGNRINRPPLDTIEELLSMKQYPIIVKEVGQGIGYESLKRLLKLPVSAVEFAAYGGTNFSMVELYRNDLKMQEIFKPFAYVGHNAYDMVNMVNTIIEEENDIQCNQLIISGGLKNYLDGYYLINKSKLPAVYGQASAVLRHAKNSYEELKEFIESQVTGYRLAETYLRVK